MAKKIPYQIFLCLLFFVFASCEQGSNPTIQIVSEKKIEGLVLISAQGDTIQTGTPIQIAGKKINTDTLPKPTQILANPQKRLTSNPQIISLEKNKVIHHSKNKYHHNQAKPLQITTAQPKKVPALFPPPTNALPFVQKKEGFHALTPEQGLNSFFINDISINHFGQVWIASNKGLSRYDGKSFRHYTPKHGLKQEEVYRLLEDRQGNVWIGHFYGLGISKYDGVNFYHYGKEEGLILNRILDLKEDQNGNIWIRGTAASNPLKQLYVKFDGEKFSYYDQREALSLSIQDLMHLSREDDPDLPNQIELSYEDSTVIYTSEFLAKNPIMLQIPHSAQKNHWIIHTTGISRIEGQHLIFYTYEDFQKSNLQDIINLQEDRFGQIWLPNQSGFGLFRFHLQSFQAFLLKDVFESSSIAAITEGKDGDIWFGSFGFGLARYDGQQYTWFPQFNQKKSYIRALYQDKKGTLWIGTMYEGLYKFDGKTFTNFNKNNGLPSNDIYAITEDTQGNIWLGTAVGGLLKFDGKVFTQYAYKDVERFESTNTIRTLITDRKGNLWIGGYGGLRKFDGKHFKHYTQKEGLQSNRVVSLLEDSKGYIWVGTDDAGLHRFDEDNFKNYSTTDGLTSNEIWTITEDTQGNIWLGADECLDLLIFEKNNSGRLEKVIEHCDMNGARGAEFYANTGLLDSKGRMWWGTNRTLLMIPTQYAQPLNTAPKIQLEEIEIAQNRVDFRQLRDTISAGKDWKIKENLNLAQINFKDVPAFYNYPTELRVPYQLNQISFRFTAFDYPKPEGLEFSYFIEGIDKQWSEPSPENKIEYRNISPGAYTLKAKAMGEEKIWSKTFEYSFVVQPPWWQTWWAYVLWMSLLMSMAYSFYRFMLYRRIEKEEVQRVKELDTLKNRLYTNITHEFRTPLTVIMGINEQIEGHENQKKLIQRNSQNLLWLVNQMLDLSKLESGKLKIDYTQGDIVLYLRYLTESFYSQAHEKDIKLNFHTKEDKLLMDYDEAKLLQILNNLLSNALKFTPNGGQVSVEISKQSVKNTLQIKVKDTGIGIPAEQLAYIFDRFYQVDNSATRKGEGTGIGLTLTKELVQLLEGELTVESQEGKGTEFIILLPIQNQANLASTERQMQPRLATLAQAMHSEEETASQDEAQAQDLPTLLIIEDNLDVVLYIKSILEDKYHVHIAENGTLGIEKALEIVPDIIISDVMMPEKDGYEVCQTLKEDERTSHIPIILLTAKATQEDKLEGLNYGADAFLNKPFDKEELFIRLQKLIEIRQNIQTYFQQNLTSTISQQNPENKPKTESLEDRFLKRLNATIEENLSDENFGIEALCETMKISRVQLHRKLKALTNLSTSIYIRQIRLLKAQELLQNTEMNISEVAYTVGFGSPAYFTQKFTEAFGKPPRASRIS